MGVRKALAGALITAGLVAASPALASHIAGFAFNEQEFTFDPTAFCDVPGGSASCTSFSATFIDFSYEAEIDQQGSNFDESGVAFFGTFRDTLGGPQEPNTGLGTDYLMYAIFTGTGTVTGTAPTGIDGTFNTFSVQIWIDPGENTLATTFTEGGIDETKAVINNADDTLILSGILNVGGFHVFGGLLAGDFDVLVDVTSFDPTVWGGTAFAGPVVQADINGVNSRISGITAPPSTFVDGRIIGSGNVSFQSVPEPGTLSLLGLGLLGFGAMMRRRLRSRAKAV